MVGRSMTQAPRPASELRRIGKGGDMIVIAGAGSIGCFVGGLLAAAGQDVGLLMRARMVAKLSTTGLHLTDFSGLDARVPASALTMTEDAALLAQASMVLITVKSADTAEIAGMIARHCARDTPVVSLQNGVGNARLLAQLLPNHRVMAGMVPFNVVAQGAGRFHRATSGDIQIGHADGRDAEDMAAGLNVAGLAVRATGDIAAVQWGKLLINLNNAINALSGMTLRDQLLDTGWRRLMADQMAEALGVLRAAGITTKSTTPVPSGIIPLILRLPTPMFMRIAARMLTIDPTARSSMQIDLLRGRITEIDELQGEILRLGRKHDVATPLCTHIAALIKNAEQAGTGSPGLAVSALRP